jgi:xylose isomerase
MFINFKFLYKIKIQLLISFDFDVQNKNELKDLQKNLNQIIKMMSRFSSILKV